jgi:hypothetical protein
MILETIETIRDRVRRRCDAVRRDPSEVTIVAVSKTFSADRIREVINAGLRDIGENYVQELLPKRAALEELEIRWHFIGHLQRNKVKSIVPWVHLIHAVDNADLAREIDRRGAQAGRTIDVLLEVNTTGEQSKHGCAPEGVIRLVRELDGLSHIRALGLMTIGPFLPDPEGSRPMFRQLRLLRDKVAALGQDNVEMRHLSMGMTGDFEVAIDEGATILRIGTAIFGSRVRQA